MVARLLLLHKLVPALLLLQRVLVKVSHVRLCLPFILALLYAIHSPSLCAPLSPGLALLLPMPVFYVGVFPYAFISE